MNCILFGYTSSTLMVKLWYTLQHWDDSLNMRIFLWQCQSYLLKQLASRLMIKFDENIENALSSQNIISNKVIYIYTLFRNNIFLHLYCQNYNHFVRINIIIVRTTMYNHIVRTIIILLELLLYCQNYIHIVRITIILS